MRKLFGLVLLVLVLPLAFCGCGGGDGGGGDGGGDFVGQWHVSGSQGNYYVTFNDDGSVIMADEPNGGPHLAGTYSVSGDTASGPLNNPGVGEAEFIATLTGDNTMDFEFIEHWHSPYKHVPLAGTRM